MSIVYTQYNHNHEHIVESLARDQSLLSQCLTEEIFDYKESAPKQKTPRCSTHVFRLMWIIAFTFTASKSLIVSMSLVLQRTCISCKSHSKKTFNSSSSENSATPAAFLCFHHTVLLLTHCVGILVNLSPLVCVGNILRGQGTLTTQIPWGVGLKRGNQNKALEPKKTVSRVWGMFGSCLFQNETLW